MSRPEWHDGEIGRVRAKGINVVWKMTMDEAEEIATFIEESTTPRDAARRDAQAIRKAVNDAREDLMLPPKGVER